MNPKTIRNAVKHAQLLLLFIRMRQQKHQEADARQYNQTIHKRIQQHQQTHKWISLPTQQWKKNHEENVQEKKNHSNWMGWFYVMLCY